MQTSRRCGVVLVAEDNPTNQFLTCKQLEKLGYTAYVVETGEQALRAYLEDPARYIAILMDWHMPEMDGIMAARAIRSANIPAHLQPIIIGMTANAMEGDREACLNAGMDDYISKPVRIHTLAQILMHWVGADKTSA